MAYAEKRGKCWRARFRRPDRSWGSASTDDAGLPFLTKTAAEEWGEDQEAAVRAGTWRDPRWGEVTLKAFTERWWTVQDVEDTTLARNRYLLDHHILPAFGERTLASMAGGKEAAQQTREEIARWELGIRWTPKRGGRPYAARTAGDARSLLRTILGDALDADLIIANPAAKGRGRGRVRTRRRARARSVKRQWCTPLQALLVAERCALMSGRDEEFLLVVTIAWTGMRWGEAIGLEEADLEEGGIRLDWQLRELAGRFLRVPPKDDSSRLVDLPPFLERLLTAHLAATAGRRCSCPGRPRACLGDSPGNGRYLFLTREGRHPRRSNFARRYWHPAADGTYPGQAGKRPWPARPVLADATTGWPGAPLTPAWTYAEPGRPFAPPEGRGVVRYAESGWRWCRGYRTGAARAAARAPDLDGRGRDRPGAVGRADGARTRRHPGPVHPHLPADARPATQGAGTPLEAGPGPARRAVAALPGAAAGPAPGEAGEDDLPIVSQNGPEKRQAQTIRK
ncbi:hypothetical protein [Actinomadura rupiterrae]|uniref:hypothetical protein n=1 Tax=Actinomadura rupiterrae TaxID=559627 RepID=UPI0020A4D9FD|nr:hypothetical protein [Actinomadura rupiterrae]MCP2339239.1 integrase [Actinomadura rupiterrae]